MSERECLRAFVRNPSGQTFRPFVERYSDLVYSAAHRQTGGEAGAVEVARAVFLALAYKARHLRRKTVLAGWLFRATRFGCLKRQGRKMKGGRGEASNPNIPMVFDEALDRLSPKYRDAVLLSLLPEMSLQESAQILRANESRVKQRTDSGLQKLAKGLRKRGCAVERDELAFLCASKDWFVPAPEGVASGILASVDERLGKRPSNILARRTLRALYWAPWWRRLKIASICLLVFGVIATLAGFYAASLWRNGRLIAWFIEASTLSKARSVPGLVQPARSWPGEKLQSLDAARVRTPSELYQMTNIWLAHLKFSAAQWKALAPRRIDPVPNLFQPDGTVLLRNPKAQRSGLAGVLGHDFDWAHADLDFAGVHLSNVGARFKGNGAYLLSLYGWKRSFKVGLNKFTTGQRLGDVEEINLTNLIDDRSFMSDALAYELFREAGVPAPRTAYAWLAVSVAGQWERKPLGLYLLVENLGSRFVAERFGSRRTPLFKPVTYRLFEDLGEEWPAYEVLYDLKTKATVEQRRRVIDFSQLVSHANDEEFRRRLGEFLDLDEFARFLACLVLLSSYDSFLADGQNFYIYLDLTSNKFGFIPWDLDHAWGAFYLIGTPEERQRASIWHPWVGRNRFLERVMGVEEFRKMYRARLEEFLARLFVPNRLSQRIDEVAQVLRSPVAAESSFRLERFEQAVSAQWLPPARQRNLTGPDRPTHQLKRFIEVRAKSVRQQLDGRSKGMILERRQPTEE